MVDERGHHESGNPTTPRSEDGVPWHLTIDEVLLPAGFERAPHPVTISTSAPPTAPSGMSDEELADLYEADPAWRAADGTRYEALLVLADGTSYGRRGPAAAAPLPTVDNGYGSGDVPDDEVMTEPEVESVILGGYDFTDRRTRVSSTSQLTGFPIRTIGAMSDTDAAGESYCTATKVGPRAAITASHCVFSGLGQWTISNWFHPGQTSSSHPNTSGTAVAFSGAYARDWRANHPSTRRYDYAVIFLDDREDSYDLSWLGIGWWTASSSYTGLNARLIGYPDPDGWCADSPLSSHDCDGWMYRDQRNLTSTSFRTDEQLGYDVDTQPGQSGSSVLTYVNGTWITLGVHWGGNVSWGENRAARFRTSMWDDVCEWIASVPSDEGSHSLCN